MRSFYTLLFTLSIILIDPWGNSRGNIWTEPKVFAVLLIALLNISILWEEKNPQKVPRSWKINLVLWGLFLGIGAISTLQSPFPSRSFWGQEQMGDGWLYWLILAAFTLSNTLLLRLHPELFRPQLHGLLIGGVILALSTFPQLINRRIDYTATTGQLLTKGRGILASTIFTGHQPIGLYSHRGHASFVLSAVGVLALVAMQQKWVNTRYIATALALIIPALLLNNTRAGILAIMVATAYLLGRKYYKLVIPAVLICLLVVGFHTFTRPINKNLPALPLIREMSTGRLDMWKLSLRGIRDRPFFGWGFDGFGIAYPYIDSPTEKPNIVRLGNFSYDYLSTDGEIITKLLHTYKAHNLILDATISVGILGMLSYLTILGFCIILVIKSPYRGIEAIAIAYFTFTLTWFECAQFAHLAWWSLSLSQTERSRSSPG